MSNIKQNLEAFGDALRSISFSASESAQAFARVGQTISRCGLPIFRHANYLQLYKYRTARWMGLLTEYPERDLQEFQEQVFRQDHSLNHTKKSGGRFT